MSEILSSLSEALADVADRGGRGLVRVEARDGGTVGGLDWDDMPNTCEPP